MPTQQTSHMRECPTCKRELSLDQFAMRIESGKKIMPYWCCAKCSSARSLNYRKQLKECDPKRYAELVHARQLASIQKNQETLKTASKWKTKWTWTDIQILLDLTLSHEEAARSVGRSIAGVVRKRSRLRDIYHFERRPSGLPRRLPRTPFAPVA